MSEAAVPVAIHGFTWSSAFLAILNVVVGGLLVAIVKQKPLLRKLENERELAQAANRKDDMDDMRERIAQLEAKVEKADRTAHEAEMKLVYAVNAFHLVAARIRQDNPDDPTLRQASDMLTAATGGVMPSWAGKLAEGLNKMKGVGE